MILHRCRMILKGRRKFCICSRILGRNDTSSLVPNPSRLRRVLALRWATTRPELCRRQRIHKVLTLLSDRRVLTHVADRTTPYASPWLHKHTNVPGNVTVLLQRWIKRREWKDWIQRPQCLWPKIVNWNTVSVQIMFDKPTEQMRMEE